MQKALTIGLRQNLHSSVALDLDELNNHLREGWKFVSAAPMASPSSSQHSGIAATPILVIIEK